MTDKKPSYGQIITNLVLTLIAFLLCFYALPRLFWFFFPLLIAWCIALIASPLVHFLEKRIKLMRKHGSALIIVLVLAAIIGIIYAIGACLFHEMRNLISDLPDMIQSIRSQLDEGVSKLVYNTRGLPFGISGMIANWDQTIRKAFSGLVSHIDFGSISTATSFAKNVADIFILTIFTFIAAYFFTADKDKISTQIKNFIPQSLLKQLRLIYNTFATAIGSYVKAQFKIMVVIFALLLLAFGLISVPYYGLVASITAVLDFLPVFGTGFIIAPWTIFAIITGRYRLAVYLIIIYLVCLIVKQVLQPKLVSDGIGLSPLSTFLCMFIGYRISGIGGLILGIPIGMILHTFYKNGVFDQQIKGVKILIHDLNEYCKF